MLEYSALFGARSSLREALSSPLAEGSWLHSWLAYMMSINNSNWGYGRERTQDPPGAGLQKDTLVPLILVEHRLDH